VSALRISACCLSLVGGLLLSRGASANPAWHTVDTTELERVRSETPQAAVLFEQAEASLRAGDLHAADQVLKDARVIQRNSYLLARRHCQVLTELGRREDALEACSAAAAMGTAMDSRAIVGALMSGTAAPKPRELVEAVRQATSARRLQNQPFSDAALCDIAYHVGDDAMLNSCVHELEAIAPDNFETARWRAVRHQTPAWALWLGWSALGSIVIWTLGHALRRRLRRPDTTRRVGVVAAAIFGVLTCVGAPAQAADPAPEPTPEHPQHWQLSRFAINWDDPESRIPTVEERNKDPLQFGYFLQDLNVEALKAERNGDWRAAVKFWRADAKAVPDMAVGFSKACRAYQMLDEVDQAIEFCSKALNLEGSLLEDYLRYAELVTGKPAALSAVDTQDLDAIVKHLRDTEQPAAAAVVECRTGVKLEDRVRLERCTQVLAKTSAQDPHTLTFQWSYALLRKDYGEAKRLLGVMEKTNMNRQALARARDATAEASAWWRRPLTDWRYAVATLTVLLLGAGAALFLRRRLEPSAGSGPAPAI
jgi:tetratricopeptide (TPR) repeat protein